MRPAFATRPWPPEPILLNACVPGLPCGWLGASCVGHGLRAAWCDSRRAGKSAWSFLADAGKAPGRIISFAPEDRACGGQALDLVLHGGGVTLVVIAVTERFPELQFAAGHRAPGRSQLGQGIVIAVDVALAAGIADDGSGVDPQAVPGLLQALDRPPIAGSPYP